MAHGGVRRPPPRPAEAARGARGTRVGGWDRPPTRAAPRRAIAVCVCRMRGLQCMYLSDKSDIQGGLILRGRATNKACRRWKHAARTGARTLQRKEGTEGRKGNTLLLPRKPRGIHRDGAWNASSRPCCNMFCSAFASRWRLRLHARFPPLSSTTIGSPVQVFLSLNIVAMANPHATRSVSVHAIALHCPVGNCAHH